MASGLVPEATAVLTSFLLEGARDGETVADLMEACRHVLSSDTVMEGVPEALVQVQVGVAFPDSPCPIDGVNRDVL